MDRIFKLPVGAAIFAALAFVGMMGIFAFSAVQPAEAQQSSNANLGSLSVMDGTETVTLTPAFRADRHNYHGSVPHSTAKVTVAATAEYVGAQVVGRGGWTFPTGNGPFTRDITVFAEDGSDQSYTVTITKLPRSSDATLKVLEVTDSNAKDVALKPGFEAGTTSYTAEVANSMETVTVKATANDEDVDSVSIEVAGGTGTDEEEATEAGNTETSDEKLSSIVTLAVAAATSDDIVTTITIIVRAEDTEATERYILRVTRKAESKNADLASLRITPAGSRRPVALNPRFDAGAINYSAEVANSVGTVTVTAIAADDENAGVVGVTDNTDDSAFMTDADDTATDADFTSDATLDPADTAATFTTLTITVTPEIGAANNKVYTIVIEREAPNSDATLKTLTVTHGDDEPVALKPEFEAGQASYTAEVANKVETVTVKATANDKNAGVAGVTDNTGDSAFMTDADNTATDADFTSDATLDPADTAATFTTLTVTVTAQDGSAKPYTVIIRSVARSTDATLKALSVNPGMETFAPAFDKDTENYTAQVPYSVESVAVTATPNNKYAKAKVDDEEDGMVPLKVGVNPIDITVTPDTTADDPTLGEYTVRVTRLAHSTDASLSVLNLWDGTDEVGDLSTSFMPGTMSYTVMADNDVESVTVAATPAEGATFMVNGSASRDVDLMVGDNTITVKVTATDGTTMMTYMITVTKAAATTDALLNRFDDDNDGSINRAEIDMAIDRFLGLTTDGAALSRADIDHLIDLFLGLA